MYEDVRKECRVDSIVKLQEWRWTMPQRFYPYTPEYGQTILCEHVDCTSIAVWWDAVHDAIWCDLHAVEDSTAPVRVECAVCGEMCPATWMKQGVCVDCRLVMPLMWVDDEVKL